MPVAVKDEEGCNFNFLFFLLLLVFSIILNAPLLIAYIKSENMSPTLQKNDLVFINIFDRDFKEGNIVVFNSNGNWICHRIVKETAEGYITKGDANIATDQFSGKTLVEDSDIMDSKRGHGVKLEVEGDCVITANEEI